jgi:hypothetical protein
LGAQKDSRTESGCFALNTPEIHPGSLGKINIEDFLAMLRFGSGISFNTKWKKTVLKLNKFP